MPFNFFGIRDTLDFRRETIATAFTGRQLSTYCAIFCNLASDLTSAFEADIFASEVTDIDRQLVTTAVDTSQVLEDKLYTPNPITVFGNTTTTVQFNTVLLVDVGDLDDDKDFYLQKTVACTVSGGNNIAIDSPGPNEVIRRGFRFRQGTTLYTKVDTAVDSQGTFDSAPGLGPAVLVPLGRFVLGAFQTTDVIQVSTTRSAIIQFDALRYNFNP